ncbi:MAG: alpha-amylase [Eubacterium sp.]|nr:alpha-amylase [Eubacterium sp.]
MAWYEEARFYHIYPLGLLDAPKENDYGEPVNRIKNLYPWIDHLKKLNVNALYIGPLFESGTHGYDTTDYKKVDSRLGTNADLAEFVKKCHDEGIKVILDGVFNHTGRDFFAFKDIKENRENSQYKNWYAGVNFSGNNEYNDGFSYENWGGYNLLVKLNQYDQGVKDYIEEVIRFWVDEFDIDGLRLDAADVLNFDFMKHLRYVANTVKEDFYLMGEVIHGEYNRWVNPEMLHSVTNYPLHKALYSGFNDHNFFEIAHTSKRICDMGLNRPDGAHLYNFIDNHDVERIVNKLNEKAHLKLANILLYTMPGIPSIYYGSEFGIEGKKENGSDDSLRPAINLEDYADAYETNPITKTVVALGKVREEEKALTYGGYRELKLTTTNYAFERSMEGSHVIVTVNNEANDAFFDVDAPDGTYSGVLLGQSVEVSGGRLSVQISANDGEVWVRA